MDTITLSPHEAIDVLIEGHTVRVQHVTDADGRHAIELGGVNCALEGELPGLYYLAPLVAS